MLSHVPSIEEIQYMEAPYLQMEGCQRTGIMASFTKFEEFENYFEDLMDQFADDDSRPDSPLAYGGEDEKGNSVSISQSFCDGNNMDFELKVKLAFVSLLICCRVTIMLWALVLNLLGERASSYSQHCN